MWLKAGRLVPRRGTDEVRPLVAGEALTGEKEVEVEVEEELCEWRCRALLKWSPLPHPRSHHTQAAF